MDILQELSKLNIPFEMLGSDEIKLACPFHSDAHPSLCCNISKNVFRCPVCNKTGTSIRLLAKIQNRPLKEVYTEHVKTTARGIKSTTVETYHRAIWHNDKAELYNRGLTDELIRYYRIGYWQNRFTIPIKNLDGKYINIRRYLPGAGKYKTLSLKQRGSNTIFPMEQLFYDKLLITGGELKAIVAAYQLNIHGIGAISSTSGEQNWSTEMLELLGTAKELYICMDIDEAGQEATEELALKAFPFTKAKIYLLQLPLDKVKYPKGDINDFIASEGGNLVDLINDKSKLTLWEHKEVKRLEKLDAQNTVNCTVPELLTNVPQNSRVEFTASILAKNDEQYVIYSGYKFKCDRQQSCCSICPLYTKQKDLLTLDKESPDLLYCLNLGENKREAALRRVFNVPKECKSISIRHNSRSKTLRLSKVQLTAPLDLETVNDFSDDTLDMKVPATIHYEASQLKANCDYKFKGRIVTEDDAKAMVLCSEAEELDDTLDILEHDQLEELNVFGVDKLTVQSINDKIVDIHTDFENNVTNIYGRLGMHVAMDLTYHSVLHYYNQNDKQSKGWLETLIIGDRGEGKSQAMSELMRHYGLGTRIDCKNGTFAGIMGGVQQISTSAKWVLTWGIMPRNDKRLVVLEELKELSQKAFSQMTDTRSSGILNISKVSGGRASCRVRLICISNPVSRDLSEYTYGVDAINHLIYRPEDIRRFDLFKVIDERTTVPDDKKLVPHKYTSDLCKRLILWVWSRKPEQIVFEPGFFHEVKELTQKLGEKFSSKVPLFDKKTGHEKVTRIAIAVAARTFNATPDLEGIYITKVHAKFAAFMLNSMYLDPDLGYDKYSNISKKVATAKPIVDIAKPGEAVENIIRGTGWTIQEFSRFMLTCNSFDGHFLRDCFNNDSSVLQSLIKNNYLTNKGKGEYVKSPEFVSYLKSFTEG